jgi:hypothetical protein
MFSILFNAHKESIGYVNIITVGPFVVTNGKGNDMNPINFIAEIG